MTGKSEEQTAATHANSAGPEHVDQAAAAAAPCGCAERIDHLEGKTRVVELLARTASWLAIASACAFLYLLFSGNGNGGGGGG
jgi:hypothetical protein